MRATKSASGLFLGLTSLLLVGATAQKNQIFADGFRYVSPDSGRITIAGVCDVTTDSMSCWQPDGTPSQSLTDETSAFFLSNPQSKLQLRFRKPNKLVVVRVLNASGGGFYNQLTTTVGYQLSNAGQSGYVSGEENSQYYWLYPSADDTTVDVVANFSRAIKDHPRIDAKVGAKATLGGMTIEITSIKKADPKDPDPYRYNMPGNTANQPRWNIEYKLTGQTDPPTSIFATAFDKSGNQIQAVDGKGKPVAPYGRNGFMGNMIYSTNLGWATPIDPDQIGSLQLGGQTSDQVVFKGLALVPKK